ncbi:hypothetical protein F0Q18_10725 [Vibrio cholerae]|nr:hypothetical protein F0Q18_10725 [Vibrio cholerae]
MVVHKAECTDGRYSLRLLAGECSKLYRCDAVLANDTTTLVSFLTRSPRSKPKYKSANFALFAFQTKGESVGADNARRYSGD